MRSKGEGTIVFDEATQRFLVKVPIGRYSNGLTQYKTKRAKTKREADRLRIQLLTERENGRLVAGPKETVKAYTDWFYRNEAGNRMRETTMSQQYNLFLNYIFPSLGHRPIVDVHPREITEWMHRLRQTYSVSTVNGARAALSVVFSSAVRNERVTFNPVSRTQKLRRGPFERSQVQPPYTHQEAAELLDAVKESPLDLFVHLALFTGMRRGEILGLWWDDIDVDNGTLFISRTLKEGSRFIPGGTALTKPIYNEPKTLSSKRIVHIPPAVVNALHRHHLVQEVQRISMGEEWIERGLVFTSPCGTEVFPSNYSARFRKFLKDKGLRHIRIHDLRHTFATLALENGVQLAAITQTLGHSGIEITKNIYAKSVPALELEATSAIAKLLDPTAPLTRPHIYAHRGVVKVSTRPQWRVS
jgi:integrase